MCVPWLLCMFAAFVCATWLIHMCGGNDSCVWQDSFMQIHKGSDCTHESYTRSHVTHMTCRKYATVASSKGLLSHTWIAHMKRLVHICDRCDSCVRQDSLYIRMSQICTSRFRCAIHVCDKTPSCRTYEAPCIYFFYICNIQVVLSHTWITPVVNMHKSLHRKESFRTHESHLSQICTSRFICAIHVCDKSPCDEATCAYLRQVICVTWMSLVANIYMCD